MHGHQEYIVTCNAVARCAAGSVMVDHFAKAPTAKAWVHKNNAMLNIGRGYAVDLQ